MLTTLLPFKNADQSTKPFHVTGAFYQLSFLQERATKDHQTFGECLHHERWRPKNRQNRGKILKENRSSESMQGIEGKKQEIITHIFRDLKLMK